MRVLFNSGLGFRSNVRVDIGGSTSEGSCKINYSTTDGVYNDNIKTTVNTLGRSNFENSHEFMNLIADKIKFAQDSNLSRIQDLGYPKSENAIKNTAIFVPSRTYENTAMILPNLKIFDNKPLVDVDFSDFKKLLKAKGVEVSDDMNFILLQDVLGAGLAVTKKLYDKGMLEAGSAYTACITGGGCGITDIKMTDPYGVTLMSSGSACLSNDSEIQKVSGEGASSKTMLKKFCKKLWLNDSLNERIIKCRKSEFVLTPTVTYQKNIVTNQLKEALIESGIFEVVNDSVDEYTVQVKKSEFNTYNAAREEAIDKYAKAFARLGVIKRNDSYNGMVITGPLALAVDECSVTNYGKTLSDRIMLYLTTQYNTTEFQKLKEVYPFNVFCGSDFSVKNNTDCGNLVHKVTFPGKNRSNWIRIDVKHLKG